MSSTRSPNSESSVEDTAWKRRSVQPCWMAFSICFRMAPLLTQIS